MPKLFLKKLTTMMFVCILLLGFFVSTPTQACACGMLVAQQSKDIKMMGEKGVIVYDSKLNKEQMAINFQLSGSSQTSALIVPTPVQAEIGQIKSEVFDDLENMVYPPSNNLAPETTGAMIGSADNVTVLERKTVGSFEIAALKTNSYADLFAWTEENNFRLESEAENPVRSYIDANFVLNLIKLKKNSVESEINPLKFTFKTDDLFYPLMEVKDSRDSQKDKTLSLYIITDEELGYQFDALSSAQIFNRSYTKASLEEDITKTDEKGFSNLDFSTSKYYLTFLYTADYSNGGLMKLLGNPEMKTYQSLGLTYMNNTVNIWLVVAIIVLLLALLSASIACFVIYFRRKKMASQFADISIPPTELTP